MMKALIAIGLCTVSSVALSSPVSGVYADLPVNVYANLPVNKAIWGKQIAYEKLFFTNEKINTPLFLATIMSPADNYYSSICCYEIRNFSFVNVNYLVKKYAVDPSFSDMVTTIKGYKYVYNVDYSNSYQSQFIKQYKSDELKGNAIKNLSPALAFKVYPFKTKNMQDDKVVFPLLVDNHKVSLKDRYTKGENAREIHTFIIDGKKSTYSYPLQTDD